MSNSQQKRNMVFSDFKKAFDSLHRRILMRILKAYGIPDSIVDIINIILNVNTKGKVITPDGDTELFYILAGVLQGDTLAPYLFIIALDYCMRQALSSINIETMSATTACTVNFQKSAPR